MLMCCTAASAPPRFALLCVTLAFCLIRARDQLGVDITLGGTVVTVVPGDVLLAALAATSVVVLARRGLARRIRSVGRLSVGLVPDGRGHLVRRRGAAFLQPPRGGLLAPHRGERHACGPRLRGQSQSAAGPQLLDDVRYRLPLGTRYATPRPAGDCARLPVP